MGLVGKSGHLVIISIKVMKTVVIMMIRMNRMRKRRVPEVKRPAQSLTYLNSRRDMGYLRFLLQYLLLNKTISDGGITVDFWFIKVHTSN